MDGQVLVNCFETEQTVAYIDSWDSVTGPEDPGCHAAGAQLDATDSRETLRQLVELGYIDEPNPDAAQAVDETSRELQYNLAQAYMDAGRFNDALKLLTKLWERWPEEGRFGTKLLSCWLALGNASQARSTLDLQLQRKREAALDAREQLVAVRAEFESKKSERADDTPQPEDAAYIQKLQRLQARAELNPNALAYQRGCVLALEGAYEDAITAFQSAEKLQLNSRIGLYAQIGAAYLELQNWSAAERYYLQMLELDATSHEALLGLAQICLKRGHAFQAAAHARASLELIYHNPKAHLMYGRALIQLGQLSLAEKTLLVSVRQNPIYVDAYDALTDLYRGPLDQPELAERYASLGTEASERLQQLREGEAVEDLAADLAEFPAIRKQSMTQETELEQSLVVVSGLPRSGTSLMMQMLEAAGIGIVSDQQRVADESNPKGYYEDARVKQLAGSDTDTRWLTEHLGQAVKIVAPLLGAIPETVPLKIVFMQRDAAELMRSQSSMLERDQKAGALVDDAALSRVYAAQLQSVQRLLNTRSNVAVLPLRYEQVVQQPLEAARSVLEFLNLDCDLEPVAGVVDSKLYRNRSN